MAVWMSRSREWRVGQPVLRAISLCDYCDQWLIVPVQMALYDRRDIN